mmetsp:Transcript_23611/g.35118  ORF Transcript_23611/g.35118 Transcript_23611/m.35118 type:complete len:849 (+) Transcript_23611:112-2658(+)|eukprot:CAMPEP_0203679130 /NCGR_PEP_ID=MMETSP0090-20130426/34466_1 /ASSEMBLY_ACC=CAM_ASM_001088 /TAXON_ID=426623 /ORGANISM="Chaetoceros affinis, Strain CCMP159" /LENGTH=848 /DNA_ID=CAMNT_0050546657 /DNA_START=36 /DNA_END=2582 /DNA_ORIENTATION=+
MTDEGKKGLSKNALKKLAKKADKEAKKKGKEGDIITNAVDKGNAKVNVTDSPSSPPLPKESVYYVANITDQECPSAIKGSVAAKAFGITLCRASKGEFLPPLFNGPALYANSNTESIAFGGNGIAKAISLLTGRGEGGSAVVDEWLELERTSLRKSSPAKVKASALAKVESALSSSSGLFVVGNSLTVADIAIVVTLSKEKGSYSAVIQSYLDSHLTSDAFVSGKKTVCDLIPPPSFDMENNPSMIRAVNSVFFDAISTLLPHLAHTLGSDNDGLVIEKSKQLKFGDYQCKEAMPLFSKLKASQSLPDGISSPQQLAQAIVQNIPNDNQICDSLNINGPGFILCKVKASYLEYHINTFMNSAEGKNDPKMPLPLDIREKGQTVVVDFSSPNIAKDMHVGHLRSTIIGESVCRILELVGADVKRVNHVGDWGTQFGMLITYLKESHPNFASGDNCDVAISDLTQIYKNAKARFDEDTEFKKTSQLNVVKLQAGDEECRAIWNVLCDISRKEFEKVYKRLDISLDECGESFYNDKIPQVIKELEEKGMIETSNGAKCVFLPNYKIPLMLQKSDGGYGYDSTDMAALKYRTEVLGATRVVCITDFSQGDHFHMIFDAGRMAGWIDEKHKLEHIGFGTVMGDDGKRFKTRSGDTVRLVDLLDEAVSRMKTSLYERIKDKKAALSEEEVPEVSATMGYGAVKYFDLRRNPTTNYQFSYDQMLDTKGNTAIYLLYAHARLESICSKGRTDYSVDVDDLISNKSAKIVIDDKYERILVLHLQMFADVIDDVLKDLYPYRICDFLYALSNAVSDFITQCKVLGSKEMESRLLLCRASAVVMRQCFTLLGIGHVKRI